MTSARYQPTPIESLCYCLSLDAEETETARLKRLSQFEWEEIFHQSVRHYVAPLLYYRLKTLDSNITIPDPVVQRLREFYLKNAARNMRLYHDLVKVFTVLRDNGIPVIVLKGAHLAEVVYGNIALRTMDDVDLLVQKNDLARCQQTLRETGDTPLSVHFPLDIHWHIESSSPDLSIEMEKVWKRAQPAVIAGVEISVLCPEDLIVHLCLHLALHHLFQFAGLRTLCDIRETLRCYATQIDWEHVKHRAQEWGVAKSVYLTLCLAKEMLGVQMPDSVLDRFVPDKFDPQVKTWSMEQISYGIDETFYISPYFWQLWASGHISEKLRSLRKLLFPSPELVSQRYPVSFGSTQNYLYYLVRLANNFIPYIRALWRIAIREKKMLSLIKRQNRNFAMKERLKD